MLFDRAIIFLTLFLQVSDRDQLFLQNSGLLLEVVICLFELSLTLGLGLLNLTDKFEKLARDFVIYTDQPSIFAVL